jgi:hypothetical protein
MLPDARPWQGSLWVETAPAVAVALFVLTCTAVLALTRPSFARVNAKFACTPISLATAEALARERNTHVRVQVPAYYKRDYGIFRVEYIGKPIYTIFIGVLGTWWMRHHVKQGMPPCMENDELSSLRASLSATQINHAPSVELERLREIKRTADLERASHKRLLRHLEDEQREALLARREALERRSRAHAELKENMATNSKLEEEVTALQLCLNEMQHNAALKNDPRADQEAIAAEQLRAAAAQAKIASMHIHLISLRRQHAALNAAHMSSYTRPPPSDASHLFPVSSYDDDSDAHTLPQHFLPSNLFSGADDDEMLTPSPSITGALVSLGSVNRLHQDLNTQSPWS